MFDQKVKIIKIVRRTHTSIITKVITKINGYIYKNTITKEYIMCDICNTYPKKVCLSYDGW